MNMSAYDNMMGLHKSYLFSAILFIFHFLPPSPLPLWAYFPEDMFEGWSLDDHIKEMTSLQREFQRIKRE